MTAFDSALRPERDDQTLDPPSAAEAAGFWIRALARLVDWVVVAIAGFLATAVLAFLFGAVAALRGRSPDAVLEGMGQSTWIGWIGGAITAVAYHSCFEGLSGSTAGKRLLGLQVLTESLQPISFLQGTRRSTAFLVDALFFGAIAASRMSDSPTKQRIGDSWAKTRVVRRRSVPRDVHPSTLRMLLGLCAAVAAAGLLTAITQLLEAIAFIQGN